MLIPDRILPQILASSASALGAVLLAVAVDLEAAETEGFAESMRPEMEPQGRVPKILTSTIAGSIGDVDTETARVLCFWNVSTGFEIVLRWDEGESEIAAWIVVSGQYVLYTRDVRSRPFDSLVKRGDGYVSRG